jgi:hypothetical protein
VPGEPSTAKLSRREWWIYTGGALALLVPAWFINVTAIRAVLVICIGVAYLALSRRAIRRSSASP